MSSSTMFSAFSYLFLIYLSMVISITQILSLFPHSLNFFLSFFFFFGLIFCFFLTFLFYFLFLCLPISLLFSHFPSCCPHFFYFLFPLSSLCTFFLSFFLLFSSQEMPFSLFICRVIVFPRICPYPFLHPFCSLFNSFPFPVLHTQANYAQTTFKSGTQALPLKLCLSHILDIHYSQRKRIVSVRTYLRGRSQTNDSKLQAHSLISLPCNSAITRHSSLLFHFY